MRLRAGRREVARVVAGALLLAAPLLLPQFYLLLCIEILIMGLFAVGFNLLAGWNVAEDTLPERFLNSAPEGDPAASLSRERLSALVTEYHRQRGW